MRRRFTNTKSFVVIVLLVLWAFCACSDKYESLVAYAPSPMLSFDRDTVVIREKDYRHVASVLNPFMRVFAVPSPPQMNIQYYEPSDKVHFTYRGVQMEEGNAIIVAGDSTFLFCSCDTAGWYSVDFYLTDHLGKVNSRQLAVNCIGNGRGSADLAIQFVDSSVTDSWEYRFDASGSRKEHGLITGYYFSVNGLLVFSPLPVLGYTFHVRGEHAISLYVKDDLGIHSDTILKKILIP